MPRGVSWVLSGWQSILNKKEVVSENVSESMQAEHGTDSYHHCGLPGLRPAWGSGGSVAIEKPLYHKLCHCLSQRERRPWPPVRLGWRKTCGKLVPPVLTLWLSHSINSLLCAGTVGSTKYSLNMAETDYGREGTQTWAEGMQGGIALMATIPPKSHW